MHGAELSPHGVPDVSWYRPEGGRMDDGNWHEPLRRTIGMMLCGDAGVHRPPEGPPVVDATFLLLLNAAPEDVDFVMPAAVKDGWRRLLDSAEPEVIDDGRFWREGDTFPLEARSLALFVEGDGRTRDTATHRMPFGAEIVPGGVHFRFWAPGVDRVDLVLGADGDERRLPMQQAPGGWFDLTTEAAGAGMVYGFGLPDGMVVPDPASRGQAEDCDGRSLVVDPDAFNWRNQEWRGRPWHEAVIMELHIGTLTAEGTFDAARRELPRLQKLGITAIQIMPLADFKGSRNWGYDGVLPYAPDRSYGSTSALKALVDQAHRLGMQVFLDVVYNHFGPVGNYLHAYAPQFFREDISTPWGAAIDFRRPEVRDFFIHNALYWLEEYRFDGLRLDAVHAIHDDSETHFLDALAAAVHQRYGNLRDIHLILENEENDADRLADVYRAQWNDDIHHCLHVLATGETEAYYADYADRPAARLGRALAEGFVFQGEPMAYREGRPRGKPSAGLPPTRFVAFAQNHDQIGNRAKGDRLSLLATPDALRAVMDVLLLAPQIPMLFMGEAYASRRPFCFFTDFGGELGEAVREGRRREFARFAAFADPERRAQIPDPEAPETFEASKLDPAELEQDTQGAMYAHVRRLLTLRRQHIVPYLGDAAGHSGTFETIGERGLSVAWTLGTERRLTMLAQMGDEAGHGFVRPAGELVHVSDDTAMGELARGTLPPWSVAVFLTGEPGSES